MGPDTLVALLLVAGAADSHSGKDVAVTGSVAVIEAPTWRARKVESALEITDDGLSAEFRVARLELLESGQAFDDIRVACAPLVLTTKTVECPSGTFNLDIAGLGRQTVAGSFVYDHGAGSAAFRLRRIAAAGGTLRLDIAVTESGVDLAFAAERLQLAPLFVLVGQFTDRLSDYTADGVVDVAGTIKLSGTRRVSVRANADLSGVSVENGSGTVAAAGVFGKLDVELAIEDGETRGSMDFDSNAGEAYLEPVYVNMSANPLSLDMNGIETTDFSRFSIREFHVRQAALLDIDGSVTIRMPGDDIEGSILSAAIGFRDTSVESLYTNLIKIAAAGTVLGDLETAGTVAGNVRIVDDTLLAANIELNDVDIDDRARRFAVYALEGKVDWGADDNVTFEDSHLQWETAAVYNIIVGGAAIDVRLGDNDIELLSPVRLATMGGALRINQLELRDFGSDDASGTLDAELEPIQLGQLTGAFGWPAFSGSLSGRLPLLRLADNAVTVGGTLSAKAFDGTMEVSGFRIEQPFGRVPRLRADVAVRGLDLERVTDAFSFGLIQGRLSGDVLGLTMRNWQVVAMDISFYTPADDSSRHRISQRAVENLASVGGGGATAILSTGFLQFFDVFAYDRIGLRCVLKDDVCEMSGAGPAKTGSQGSGYYIVKGRGLPRIDVVGYRDAVSWPGLVQQLTAITRAGSPTLN